MTRSRGPNRSQHDSAKSKASSPQDRRRLDREGGTHSTLRGWRLWCLRTVTALASTGVFLFLLEGGLHLAGVGYPTRFFIRSEQPGILTTNLYFGWHYQQETLTTPQPCLLPVTKSPDAIRIFVLGESAAMGTPDPSFGLARVLEVMLREYFPGRRLEVVNTAMRGVNSHVIADIARECAALKPDLVIVYMGNNEACGLYSPTTRTAFLGRHPAWIPVFHVVKQTRIGQLIRRIFGDSPDVSGQSTRVQAPDFFARHLTVADGPQRAIVYRNFQENLRKICRTSLDSGASVIVSTVASNLRDFPPLGSLHDRSLTDVQRVKDWGVLYRRAMEAEVTGDVAGAVAGYRKAAEIDGHYAELQFRLARCCLAAGDPNAAARCFVQARDWDALQFRADSRINDLVRQVAAEHEGRRIAVVDAEKALATGGRCANGIPGPELFYEHVHLNFDGNYELARAILPAALQALERDRGLAPSASASMPAREQCARVLAFTRWDEVNTAAAMADLTSKPPFTLQYDHAARQASVEKQIKAVMDRVDEKFVGDVIRVYREAVAANPQDWQVRYNLGALYQQLQRYDDAARELDGVVQMMPHVPSFRILLGYALGKSGRWDEATRQFREALKRDRHNKQAREGVAWAGRRGR